MPMSVSTYDCKTQNPLNPGTPYYHECFGFFQLPTALKFEAGPFTNTKVNIPPDLPCNLTSKAQRTGQLDRDGLCEFKYSWSDGDFSIFLVINENKVPLTTKKDLIITDMTKWQIGGTGVGVKSVSYCNVDLSGSVTLEISGTIVGELCTGPFRIWFDPTISPLVY